MSTGIVGLEEWNLCSTIGNVGKRARATTAESNENPLDDHLLVIVEVDDGVVVGDPP